MPNEGCIYYLYKGTDKEMKFDNQATFAQHLIDHPEHDVFKHLSVEVQGKEEPVVAKPETPKVFRHAESEANATGKKSSDDTPLTDKGIEQAKELGNTLKDQGTKTIYHSNQTRSKQTAEEAAKEAGAETKELPNSGEKTSKETDLQFVKRAAKAKAEIDKLPQDAAVISHGLLMKAMDALDQTDGDVKEAVKIYKKLPDHDNAQPLKKNGEGSGQTGTTETQNQGGQNAVQEQSAGKVDVRKPSGNGEEVGEGHPEPKEATKPGEEKEEAPIGDEVEYDWMGKSKGKIIRADDPGSVLVEDNDLKVPHRVSLSNIINASERVRLWLESKKVAEGGKLYAGVPFDKAYNDAIKGLIDALKAGEDVLKAVQNVIDHFNSAFGDSWDRDKVFDNLKRGLAAMGKSVDNNKLKDVVQSRPKTISTEAALPEGKIPDEAISPDGKVKKNYSSFGRLKDVRVRNLSQLKKFSEDIKNMDPLREVRKYVSSNSQAKAIVKSAQQSIVNRVGKSGWDVLRTTLAESRLRGAENRWKQWAVDALEKSDREMDDLFDGGSHSQMYSVVNDLNGLVKERDPGKTITTLMSNGNYDEARKYMADLFGRASKQVFHFKDMGDGKTFDQTVKGGKFIDPAMQSALETYKKLIETPMSESHSENEGVFSNALGPLDTYYPMVPVDAEGQPMKRVVGGRGASYHRPSNINNAFFKGTADNYSTEVANLSSKIAASLRVNNKATAIDALKRAGLIQDVGKDFPDGDTMINVNGELMEGRKVKVSDSRMVTKDGKTTTIPSKYAVMPRWLARELKPAFEKEKNDYDEYSLFGNLNNRLVKFQLGGPLEATGHTFRLVGGILNSMPFVHEWAYNKGIMNQAGGLVLNNYFMKPFLALGKVLFQDISTEDAMQTIQKMARNGDLPEKTWSKTWSKEFADLTGATKVPLWDFGPILYGKKSLDLKARVAMYRLTEALNPGASPEIHTKMQQQLGVYTHELQGEVERVMKKHGIAPFYSFASAIYREGARAVLGGTKMALDRPSLKETYKKGFTKSGMGKYVAYKSAQLLTSGVLGAVGYWVATYKLQTDKYPWEDPNSKLLKLPFPEWAKNMPLAQKMFYNEKNRQWDDINMGFFNPYLDRGMRAFGAPNAYQTAVVGGTPGQAIEAGQIQILNTSISPYTTNPLINIATGTLGFSPYIMSERGERGQPDPQFFSTKKTVAPGMQLPYNFMESVMETNPIVARAAESGLSLFGLNNYKLTYDSRDNDAISGLKMIIDIALPRITSYHGNPEAKARFLKKENKSIHTTMRKEKAKEEKSRATPDDVPEEDANAMVAPTL